MKVVHLVARGLVQGVGYRMWCAARAEALGLEGWARNRRDGTVEAVFAGEADAVDEMLEACRSGPPMARVDALDVREGPGALLDLRDGQGGFVVLATA